MVQSQEREGRKNRFLAMEKKANYGVLEVGIKVNRQAEYFGLKKPR